MRIIYVDHYAGSIRHGMEYRPYYFAREWERKGHEVMIVAASFSHLRKENPTLTSSYEYETVDDIRYLWLKSVNYEGSGLKRSYSMLEFCRRLWKLAPRLANEFKPDVVISSSTYPLDHYPAHRLAKLAGAVLIHEIHDLWPLSPMELGGYGPGHPFIRVMQRAENKAYTRSDQVVSLLPGTLEYMKDHGITEDRWHYIPNGVVEEDWEDGQIEPTPDHVAERINALKETGKFILGYAGGHSVSNAMNYLIDACRHIQRRAEQGDETAARVTAVLVGRGTEKENLIRQAKEAGIRNIEFLDPIPKQAIPDLLPRFDACYLGWTPSRLYEYGTSPNKLFDYMMAGRPVVHAFGYANDLVRIADCGLSVDERENPEEIAEAVLRMAALTAEERTAMGERGRIYVQQHHLYGGLADDFLKVMANGSIAAEE